MKRTGRVLFILFIVLGSIAGLWLFQGWRANQRVLEGKTLCNVYITGIKEDKLYGIQDGKKVWTLASAVGEEVHKGVADVYMEENEVVKIIQKPDLLQGKILKINEDSLQVEEYGDILLDKQFRLFHVASDGMVSEGKREELQVGYTDIQYVVAGKKVCAALLGESKPTNIRVLLSEGANQKYDMQEVVVSATTEYEVSIDGKLARYPAGRRQMYHFDDVAGRIIISPVGEGKIRLENLKRQCGIPEYRGKIEIEKVDKQLHVINEVDLEQYLYSVVPSEMPTEYPREALKAQAVCARSYALLQMQGNRLAKWGAHVDDSVAFQVYNNLCEDKVAIEAVEATKSQVLARNRKVVPAYFYSVSCGCSEGIKDVWFAKTDVEYLPVKWQGEKKRQKDLSEEKAFETFLQEKEKTYDATSPWYRWKTVRKRADIEKNLSGRAKERYQSNPTQIQTRQADGSYRSTGRVEVGNIENIMVVQRGKGGVARTMEVEGDKGAIRVYTEYNIRYLLGDERATYTRKDKKKATGLSSLPSGFFVIKKQGDAFRFRGGGYGHGVGMSQYGAKTMAEQGKAYQDILTFYFQKTNVLTKDSLL